ncbi:MULTISPECIES: hypothetical protein [unclassified Methanoregula]|uniref:hypothetical protein n=1 Tax=unclassified Methanoregula TaxID=2649730 RepID=UPI0009D3983E|nr:MULTISPECIES: hypothetical protein [unclassified Methanoregula]OPX62841.1 MAG: hypothetical protein A4E33_01970 [Methanoregula sp. PtaB.Bin085]OPY35278.1 MAG: hypothetical protein A4E34_00806 [Methanoregula sp. PtaU1.Bin006]
MEATPFDILMILSLGVLAGTGTGLIIGFLAGIRKRQWASMPAGDRQKTILLILACSSVFIALLSWYLFQYSEGATFPALF